ncbi:hypothetical protein NEDG_02202 [Nematocida displodere]|uniref:RING-type domain-containing protein n=1 Tax=Nematocida displodere TaxID=1805483 RepID=A0A177EG87_9MICR|nr:hypothetical protein NEDG_02202 [Nematocida displodere]
MHPMPRYAARALEKVLVRGLVPVLVLGLVFGAGTDRIYLSGGIHRDAPYTSETLVFFRVSGCELAMTTHEDLIYLDRKQPEAKIHLDRYTLEMIPEKLNPKLEFASLEIRGVLNQKGFPVPLNKEVVGKVFLAFGTLHVAELALYGISIYEVERIDFLTPRCLHGWVDWYYNTTYFRITVHTEHLKVANMFDGSARCLLSCFNLEHSQLALTIRHLFNMADLHLLDCVFSKGLVHLSIHNAEKLATIDCFFLLKKHVRDGFELWNTSNKLCPSPEIVQALASKHWTQLAVPVEMWKGILAVSEAPFGVDELAIDCGNARTPDPLWDIEYQAKLPLKTLTITFFVDGRLTPAPNKSLEEILSMIDSCFVGVEEVRLDFDRKCLSEHINYPYICIEPLLPRLKRLVCSYIDYHKQCLYSSRNILWIAPNAYSDWASGKLTDEMKNVCREYVFPLNGNVLSLTPFLPTTHTTNNPKCFECYQSVDDFNGTPADEDAPMYLGIVCNSGHMACITCLKKLAKKKRVVKEPLCCPICDAVVAALSSNSIIERDDNGTAHFKILQ